MVSRTPDFPEINRLLIGQFALVDLGSASARLPKGLEPFRRAITLIEIDATSSSETANASYFRRIALKGPVSSKAERRTLHLRKFPQCSSFLSANPQLISAYGLQDYFEEQSAVEFECHTLASLLDAAGINHMDLLKTDLEGIDFEVLASAPELVKYTLVVQSELRFQPLYEGEPSFHIVVGYLADLGFEIVTLWPEFWKYDMPQRDFVRDGRLAWADGVFFLKADLVQQRFGADAGRAFVKQIILAKALGLHNYAEYLFTTHQHDLPDGTGQELSAYLAPSANLHGAWLRLIKRVAALPGGYRLLALTRGVLLRLTRSLTFFPFRHLAASF